MHLEKPWKGTINMAVVNDIYVQMRHAFGREFGTAIRFDAKQIPTESVYVAWIDAMGSSRLMKDDISEAASAIGRFQSSLLNAYSLVQKQNPSSNDVSIHALTDGAYLVSHSAQRLQEMLRFAMRNIARTFVESSSHQRVIVRCSVAYGNVVLGNAMRDRLMRNKSFESAYLDSVRNIVLGAPFEAAYHTEVEAPPFGVFVDGSALGKERFNMQKIWKWWDESNSEQKKFCEMFSEHVVDHFRKLRRSYYVYGLSAQKIGEYIARTESYFGIRLSR